MNSLGLFISKSTINFFAIIVLLICWSWCFAFMVVFLSLQHPSSWSSLSWSHWQSEFNEIPKTLITAEDKDVIDLIIHSLDEQKKPLGKALDLRENQTRGKNKDKRIKYKTQRRNGRSLAHIGRR